ncbi:OmpA family protein [Aquincola sp. S2]|uniref:OmpA family protein n=1 Tax=Pseudaquabacterium terrae TaxID=2732868 RepID=A0ABX2E9C7_9BURK|nr:OmpA family protein [Aquabacterium terrae]NRF65589.1 OmpA family protein [Aquabacterium terrae]
MKRLLSATAVACGLLLGACASTPSTPPELLDARAAVRQAESDPAVLAHAALELKKATDTLNRANDLLAKREAPSAVISTAHVAHAQARTAMALAAAKRDEDAIKTAEADRERARADVRTAEAQRARAQASSAQAQANVANAQAAAAQNRALSAEQLAAQAQADAAAAQQRTLILQQRLTDLQAKETERGLLVTLGDVLFEFNRADLRPTAQGQLQKLADFLKQYPDRRVLIEGHTDSVGSAAYNEQLSRRRAEAVASVLTGMGIGPNRVTFTGYGKSYPVADNRTDTNRALNRRVEVYISNNDQPVRMRG